DGLRGDAVRGMLGIVDHAGVLLAILVVVHERGELVGGTHDLRGVGVEEVEETALAGQEASEHGPYSASLAYNPPLPCPLSAFPSPPCCNRRAGSPASGATR